MPKFRAEFFGGFLLALAYLSAVDHHVVFVGDAINANGTKGEVLETHDPSLQALYSRLVGASADTTVFENVALALG